jgi:hypothetical protein
MDVIISAINAAVILAPLVRFIISNDYLKYQKKVSRILKWLRSFCKKGDGSANHVESKPSPHPVEQSNPPKTSLIKPADIKRAFAHAELCSVTHSKNGVLESGVLTTSPSGVVASGVFTAVPGAARRASLESEMLFAEESDAQQSSVLSDDGIHSNVSPDENKEMAREGRGRRLHSKKR